MNGNALPVLLAEDDPVNRLVMRHHLTSCGCQVTTADDGDQAVARAQREAFGLIFMDCQMPGLDGLQVTAAIRVFEQEHGLPRQPILAMTASDDPGDRDLCIAAGMDAFLTKPVRAELVASLLPRWRRAAERYLRVRRERGTIVSD